MAAEFGAFQVNRSCRHTYGEEIDMALEPGRFEPQSAQELVAMRHLATVPAPLDADGEPGEPFVVLIEEPAPPVSAGQVPEPDATEPVLAEPPAAEQASAETPAAPAAAAEAAPTNVDPEA